MVEVEPWMKQDSVITSRPKKRFIINDKEEERVQRVHVQQKGKSHCILPTCTQKKKEISWIKKDTSIKPRKYIQCVQRTQRENEDGFDMFIG